METYAAMITIMDKGIGEIVNELKREGIFDNTVIIFLQDNGGNAEGTGYGGPNGGDPHPEAKDTAGLETLPKDSIQYAINPPITRDGKLVMIGKKVMAGPADTYLAYLKPWANLSNTPFCKYKNFTYEGGISTPLIIHWPDGIKAKRGTLRKQAGHEIDIMPTIAALAKATYPAEYNGQKNNTGFGSKPCANLHESVIKPACNLLGAPGKQSYADGKMEDCFGRHLAWRLW